MVRFSLQEKEQRRLELLVSRVIARAHRTHQEHRIETHSNQNGHNHNSLDTAAMAVYAGAKERYAIYMEGATLEKRGAPLLVADPMDGSGKASLLGPYSSPLSTTAMLIQDGTVLAAAAGAIWPQTVYGIDQQGLYVYRTCIADEEGHYREYLRPEPLAPSTIRLSAFLQRPGLRGRMLEHLAPLQSAEELILETDGGGRYPLLVAENTKQLHAAAELKPVPLYEHITAVMALWGGCVVTRADGSELLLDPTRKQTSLTSCSDAVHRRLLTILSPMYERLGLCHADSDENYLSISLAR